MRRIGYEFFSPRRAWFSGVTLERDLLVAVLAQRAYAGALKQLREEVDLSWVGGVCVEIADRFGEEATGWGASWLFEIKGVALIFP
jgi:hypothetical protein